MEKSQPFSIQVNGGRHEFAVATEDARHLDIVPNGDQSYQILHLGKSYHADLLEVDHPNRKFTFRINGVKYDVQIADHYDRLIKQLGLHVGGGQKQNAVKAPMPGLVLNVMVEPGQEVSKGQALLILEAMKMENVIKAAADCKIKSVVAYKGMAVEKNALLMELE